MTTTKSIKASEIRCDWLEVDATGKVLGRLATVIAHHLCGKHRANYTPHAKGAMGDYIIVKNASKLVATGNKLMGSQKKGGKMYFTHSGFPGGIKQATLAEVLDKDPALAIENAVRGMLPKGPSGRAALRKLKVYAGAEHPHSAQQPKVLTV